MSEHGGMLGAITEAAEIYREEGVTLAEAFRLQERRVHKRVLAHRRKLAKQPPEQPSNVIQFRPRQ
jgi:hypothetical protein